MTKFIPAAELKKKYSVKGRYYILTNKKSTTKCRSLLTITEDKNTTVKKLLVVMLNPGSSRPLDENFKEKKIDLTEISKLNLIPLIDAKPDVTQYQVMRVMDELNFSHAEILNLYDIREPKSLILFDNVKKGKVDHQSSVFSNSRKKELSSYFTPTTTVILAWGNGKAIADHEKNAIQKIEKLTSKVFTSRTPENVICHPSPQNHSFKLRWLDDIIGQLKKSK